MNTVQDIRAGSSPPYPLVRKLAHHSALSESDMRLLNNWHERSNRLRAGVRLHPTDSTEDDCFVVQSGWIMTYTELEDGRRQILRFALPGDVIADRVTDGSPFTVASETLTRSEVSRVPLGSISEIASTSPSLSRALEGELHRETMRLGSQVLRLGRLTAYERVAHLIIELYERCKVIGLVDEDTMPFPLTQSVIADALGLSLVHVNRQFSQLRSEGIITLRKKRMTMDDHGALVEIANYGRPGSKAA